MPLTIYGIKNCNSMKKAFDALTTSGQPYQFHDYKKEGITSDILKNWLKFTTIDQLLNKKGTTWRKLSPEQQTQAQMQEDALLLMVQNPSLIKRPVIVTTDEAENLLKITVGEIPAIHSK